MFNLPNLSSKALLLSSASLAAILMTQPANAVTFSSMTGRSTSSVTNAMAPRPAIGAGVNSPNLQPGVQSQSTRDFSAALAAIQAKLAGQAAARTSAQAGPNNLGMDPTHPGVQLADVPNGLGVGGLNPVANPKTVAQDASGLVTWDGASAPTQTTDTGGHTDVTIQQNQKTAILSWKSFNVGKNTTLTFDQKGNADWTALNRVVGTDATPSQILGQIKADGTVLVINQNGILFGGSSQINTHGLIATTLDVGPASAQLVPNGPQELTNFGYRNQFFLQNGLIGDVVGQGFSAMNSIPNTALINVDAGASITTSGEGGEVIMIAPTVTNAGHISSPAGQVILGAADKAATFTASTGSQNDTVPGIGFAAPDPDIRGVVPFLSASDGTYVWNKEGGLIEAERGNVTLMSAARSGALSTRGATYNDGIVSATTSVSRNGSIVIDGADIRLGPDSLLSIAPDTGGETIPQDPTSLAAFKPSAIKIGPTATTIEMQSGATLFAPGADVQFGMPVPTGSATFPLNQSILIDAGTRIDVAGLTDVLVPATENQVVIDPVKKNELRDSPLYRDGFLNGATVYLDPRISGVRDDGVAWIGSPLIDAAAYYQLVGIGADRLMTKGGNVGFGSPSGIQDPNSTPAVVIREGAVIDMSGGWVTYQAGTVRETRLITADGRIVPISKASLSDTYIGVYGGFQRVHQRWAITDTYTNTLLDGSHFETEYSEGRDAGTLSASGYAVVLDGTIYGDAYTGRDQLLDSKVGTGKSTVLGDSRAVQGSSGELPAGGALILNTLGGAEIVDVIPGTPDGAYDDWIRGQISDSGIYTKPDPVTAVSVPQERRDTLYLSDAMLSGAGLSEVSLTVPGKIVIHDGTVVTLNPGGIFNAVGQRIQVDGDIAAPSGKISLETGYVPGIALAAGEPNFDIAINGNLSVAGRWVNEYGGFFGTLEGSAWLDGGTISLKAAANLVELTDSSGVTTLFPGAATVGQFGPFDATAKDLSGSILVDSNAMLDLSGGGGINHKGVLYLGAKGGNLSLTSAAGYYQTSFEQPSGFRIVSQTASNSLFVGMPVNPGQINARIVLDPGSIRAHGFGGGGTFSLMTPQFALGDDTPATGTVLPFDFFSTAGFASYNITSNKTEFSPSTFTNGFGGYNALLATQTIDVGAGKNLALVQSVLPNQLSHDQQVALRALATGGDVNSIVQASVPSDAWDQKAVNLTLGGALELHVAAGGGITGAAGSSLTVGGLLNEGTIRIAAGKITQDLTLARFYATGIPGVNDPIGIRALSDVFSVNPDGTIDPNAFSQFDPTVTNQDIAGFYESFGAIRGPGRAIYKLGLLDQGEGIVLAQGSVTDLSGAVILNPYARIGDRALTTGTIYGGGTLATLPGQSIGATLDSPYRSTSLMTVQPGAVINLSGVSGTFDMPTSGLGLGNNYAPAPVWSDAGALLVGNGGTFTGAVIHADGGSANANGGLLQILNPIFTQHDPLAPAKNVIAADMIAAAGFDTLVAQGNITSQGDVTLALGRAFILQAKPLDISVGGSSTSLSPVIGTGGAFAIEAPYIALENIVDQAAPAATGIPGTGTVTFRADQIDVVGAALFDRSVSRAAFESRGDIRLIGISPLQVQTPSLNGMISVNGDLSMTAAQIYPTTGTSFSITSTAADGTITFGRSGTQVPDVPYSAGGNLTVQAANIVQGGVLRVPFGTLTLGGNASYTATVDGSATTFAPASKSIVLADGSVTSVSADGLSIPYGTTTDTLEWYFAPTGSNPLSGPPVKVLSLNGNTITLESGAVVDLMGGGDVYAYEFVPGTGGSHDVLDRLNLDQYSGNKGYQYTDQRQVYAIVPGLSSAPVAAYDPIYSADYTELQSAGGVGKRVWLDAAPGLTAGWYTLLPAKYAMLPGGMRVVEQTGAANVERGTGTERSDGTVFVSGVYGDALTGAAQSQVRLFSVESQDVIRSYSNIALTSGNQLATDKATDNGTVTPPTGIDAGRLVLNPIAAMTIDAVLSTVAAKDGRGAQIDITGQKIDILPDLSGVSDDGTIHLTATGLNNLNAESLLIGGTRTDNADGTTTLLVTANTITVANDEAHPLVAPEIVLAVDDGLTGAVASGLILKDGAAIIAKGALNDTRSGSYIIDGQLGTSVNNGQTSYIAPLQSAIGALVRVANGPERLVQRLRTPITATNPGSPAGLAADLAVGEVTLEGDTVGLDTSNDVSIAPGARLNAKAVSLDANAIAFTDGTAPAGTVVITPQLQAVLSQGDHLTLRAQTSIGFDDGAYNFGDTNFDAATLLSREGGLVSVAVGDLQLSNAGFAGTAADGAGTLDITAKSLSMGSGGIATDGFGAVKLTAAGGIFATGTDGSLDVGSASLAITTPYIGDSGASDTKTSAGMTFKSGGAVTIARGDFPAFDAASLAGVPGAQLAIQGNGVTISGTHLRATAGSLTVRSAGGVTLSDGAILEAPGYAKTFGDAADPQTVSAPGGTLLLAAMSGDMVLGDSHLSVGGGSGNAGTLTISVPNGAVDWGSAVLDGNAGAGGMGGSFALDTGGSIDLVALNGRAISNGFTGGLSLRTRTGDIVLGAGQTLKSGSVNLTADGGFVTIAGKIDTSGVNGGDIALYGLQGVTLTDTARLDSHADGYAADDTRKAHAGDILLGTDFITSTIGADGGVTGTSGIISVAAGAVIDASARRPGDRLVRFMRGTSVDYTYVEGDEGGSVSFRAPVVNGNSVNVQVGSAGSIVGAKEVVLEGFKRWDLATAATSGLYSGISYDAGTNTVTLDVADGLDTANSDGTLTSVGGLNLLGDKGAGTVVQFVQDFDVSSVYGQLGGLAGQANFRARPGVELDHSGNIVLASNWNLGAGTVNVDAAIAAGLMAIDRETNLPYIIPGKEAALLANFTDMTYRVGGHAVGAAPVISIRAGGDLDIKGSLTDGFFQFRDQYDPTYQSVLNGVSLSTVLGIAAPGGDGSSAKDWQTYVSDSNPHNDFFYYFLSSYYGSHYVGIDNLSAGGGAGGRPTVPHIPFSASGNSAAAQGTGPGGSGDPLASAVVMPLLPDGRVVDSSTYRLTAGAAPSVDPSRIAAAATGSIIVDGQKPQSMTLTGAVVGGGFEIQLVPWFSSGVIASYDPAAGNFLDFMLATFPGLSADAVISLSYDQAIPTDFQSFIDQTLAADPNAHVKDWHPLGGSPEVAISVDLFSQFLQQFPNGFPAASGGGGGGGTGSAFTIPLLPQTVIRTGTGAIHMAAAGNVDLTGGPTRYIQTGNGRGTLGTAPDTNDAQLGGAAVYTAGHPAASILEILPDPVTGAPITVSAPASTSTIFTAPPPYLYGVGQEIPGTVLADTLDLTGGGDIDVTAGGDVLSRRDLSLRALNTNSNPPPTSIGYLAQFLFFPFQVPTLAQDSYNQAWRKNNVLQDATTAAIDPQFFREGLGALGGGDIHVTAGETISDLQAVSDTSLLTASLPTGKILVTLGGGNVVLHAGSDILAARVDVASGTASITAGGNIGSLPVQFMTDTFQYTDPDNVFHSVDVPVLRDSETFIRVDDATVDLAAGGALNISQILQLDGFYSDRSALNLLANGSINVSNSATRGTANIGGPAIYPGTLTLASLTGDANLHTFVVPPDVPSNNPDASLSILMVPSPYGQLNLFAGGDIASTRIAMLDGDPNLLPGLFTLGGPVAVQNVLNGADLRYQFSFPAVLPSLSESGREQLHTDIPTHAGDDRPVYVYADGDIGDVTTGLTLSVPKQARVYAGRDILNMMFFGQNLAADDVTRIVAGRDLIADTRIASAFLAGTAQPFLLGNTFVLGGPGDLMVEAGRNMGPFLNSAVISDGHGGLESLAGGILSVGNDWNPFLPNQGANVTVLFGTGRGTDFEALRDAYLDPANVSSMPDYLFEQQTQEIVSGGLTTTLKAADRSKPLYGGMLVSWMQQNAPEVLSTAFGTTNVSIDQAYTAFLTLPELRQRLFLINDVYFGELRAPAIPDGPSYLKYSRGYTAVNTLFPAELGYTTNSLEGGANDGAIVHTGDLDLRLATIESLHGGDIDILGPGGRVLAGSVVSTAEQAARRSYAGTSLYNVPGQGGGGSLVAIPPGYEGVITQNGGTIDTFTDGDFLLNQSRLFTVNGGDITMWSSNADLNAGQGAKTTPSFPPVQVTVGKNLFVNVDQAAATSGAGIAAFPPEPGVDAPDVYLLAPRGTVDAGDAGIRVAGDIFIAALAVANADNIKVGGTAFGLPPAPVTNLTLTTASTAATEAAGIASQMAAQRPVTTVQVEVTGFGGDDSNNPDLCVPSSRKSCAPAN